MGQGVIKDIPVVSSIDVDAFSGIYLGIVCTALTKGFEDSYGAYSAGYNDALDLTNGGTGKVTSRLNFLNDILGILTPKILPFRLQGKIGYEFNNDNLVLPGPIFPVRGKLIYLYNKGTTIINGYSIQDSPSAYTEAGIMKLYNDMNTILSGTVPHLQVEKNVQLTKKYAMDASGYARVSPYEGAGYSAISGWFNSVEAEIPFRSPHLATLLPFSQTEERSSRKLRDSAGDSAMAFGLGLHSLWNVDKYNGPVPIVLMPIDIDEIIFTITQLAVAAIGARRQLAVTSDTDIAAINTQWPFTYMDWSIMWRQQLVTMFAESQAITHTLCYAAGNNRWESLKVGSNCCGLVGAVKALIPQLLNVNLSGLREVIDPYSTKRLNSPRNVVRYIPVLGAYLQRDPEFNVGIAGYGSVPSYQLFGGPDASYPDFWDGTYNNLPADLNRSPRITRVLDFWNDAVVPAIEQVCAPFEPLGGRHLGSPFLKLARYCSYFAQDFDLGDTPAWKIKRLPQHNIKEKKIETKNEKRVSGKVMKELVQYVFAPSGFSYYTTASEAYTAVNTITDTHKEYFPQLIIPVFDVSDSVKRTLVSRMMVQNQHTNIYRTVQYDSVSLNDISSSRATELTSLAVLMIKGTAGETSALAKYYANLGNEDKGGFFGDILATLTPIAQAIGL